MKIRIIITIALLSLQIPSMAKSGESNVPSRLNIGAGYFGAALTEPGFLLEFEYNRIYDPLFSLPLRANLGYHHHKDYHALFLC